MHVLKRHKRKTKCDYCDYTSNRYDMIQAHTIAKHTSIRYDCDECDFQTAYKQMVRKHKKDKHSNGVHPYNCDSCIFTAATTSKLDTHRKNVHGAHFGCHLCEFYPILTLKWAL